jgi:chalcone isomerase-like protein
MKTAIPALLALFLALPALPAAAGSLAGVTLPDKVDAGGKPLVLNGMGLRKKLFIKVYVGGLYLPQKEKSAAKVLAADVPRRMLMHFIYDVSKDQMCEAWEEGLEANTPNASAEVKKNFKTLCTWMDGVGKGQQLALTYVPGEGTHVDVGGKHKGVLPGKPTADAILSTWIGKDPGPGEDFKKAVLGE